MMRVALWEGLRIALQSLAVHKMRSLLTMTGIIIGITTVTLMTAVINGLDREFDSLLSGMSADVLYIERLPRMRTPDAQWWTYINRPNVKPKLADVIEQHSGYATAAVPVVQTGRTVQYGSKTLRSVPLVGTDARYVKVHHLELLQGRFFNAMDDQTAQRTCVIGNGIADRLFPIADPIGKTVLIGGERFKVIGVMRQPTTGADEDIRVMVSMGSFNKVFGTRHRSASVQVKVAATTHIEAAEEELTGIVRLNRRLDARAENNFEVSKLQNLQAQMAPVRMAIYGVGLFMTALSLLVGGIGVMNIMFVSVKERTREIGVRKALGARPQTIMLQFLMEAVTLCVAGGLLGVSLAYLLAQLVDAITPTVLSAPTVYMALGLCVVVGLCAGLVPAWAAAKAQPVDAFRYE